MPKNHHSFSNTPEIKQQIIEMALNSSSVRDIVRVLRISPATVTDELKKKALLKA